MPKTRQQKKEDLEKTKKYMEESQAIVFLDYSGISVNDFNELRQKLAELGSKIVITKNTLLKRANEKLDLQGQTAVLYGFDKLVEPIKALYEFRKAHDKKPEVKLGILEGKIVTKEDIKQISTMPSISELQAKLVGSMQAPLYGFVAVTSGVYSSFVRVINAYKESKS